METEREALKLGLHGGFGQESPARTFYPGAPHKYVLAAQGRKDLSHDLLLDSQSTNITPRYFVLIFFTFLRVFIFIAYRKY